MSFPFPATAQIGGFNVHEVRTHRNETWAQFSNGSNHSLASTLEIREDELDSLSLPESNSEQAAAASAPRDQNSGAGEEARQEADGSVPRDTASTAISEAHVQSPNTVVRRSREQEAPTEQPRRLGLREKISAKLRKIRSKVRHEWAELKKINQRAYMGWHPKKVRQRWEDMVEGNRGPSIVRTPTPYHFDRTQYSGTRGSVIPPQVQEQEVFTDDASSITRVND